MAGVQIATSALDMNLDLNLVFPLFCLFSFYAASRLFWNQGCSADLVSEASTVNLLSKYNCFCNRAKTLKIRGFKNIRLREKKIHYLDYLWALVLFLTLKT